MKTLRLAIEEACFLELETLPTEAELEKQIVCSLDFEKRMSALFHPKIQDTLTLTKYRISKRILLVAIITAMLASAMSVQAIRQPLLNFVVEFYEKCSRIIYSMVDPDEFPFSDEDRGFVIPTTPDGFEMIRCDAFDALLEVEYISTKEAYLIYSQYKISGSVLSVDTEGSAMQFIEICGHDGFFFTNKGTNNISWNDKNYGYHIYGNCSLDIILQIAKSIYNQTP